MCQMSLYVGEGENEQLLKENLTKLEVFTDSIRVSSLFEGPTDLTNMLVRQIDFTAGKVFLEKRIQ